VALQSDFSSTAGHQAVLANLPPEISFTAACFTHSLLSGPDEDLRDRLVTLRCFLPASEEMIRLKAFFYKACTLVHDPVPEETFEDVFRTVYETPWDSSGCDEPRILHVHAVMFMFLALASTYDAALPADVSALISHSCMSLNARIAHQVHQCCWILRACVCVSSGHEDVRSANT
jgi:hypothetical protein